MRKSGQDSENFNMCSGQRKRAPGNLDVALQAGAGEEPPPPLESKGGPSGHMSPSRALTPGGLYAPGKMDRKTAAAVVPGSCPTQAGSTVDHVGLTLKGQRMQAGVNEAWILCLWLQRGAGYICVDLTQSRVSVI